MGTLFAQYVAGYAGSSVERRGEDAEATRPGPCSNCRSSWTSGLSLYWQNRPHAGLRHPLMPGEALTPNGMYAALVETAGYVPVPLAADDYIELLPAGVAGGQRLRRQDRQPHLSCRRSPPAGGGTPG